MASFRTERLGLILTPTEKTALVRLAGLEDASLAETVRRLIRDQAQQHGLWPPDAAPQKQERSARRDQDLSVGR